MSELLLQLELPFGHTAHEPAAGRTEAPLRGEEQWVERESAEYAEAASPASCGCERPLLTADEDPHDEPRCIWCGHRVELAR